ncbi:MAG: DUF2723 domain-containing protein [Acidobacteria bacterium]|nr:DUF2723 domain-containing protein [Acidobacteriota bacterium]
MPQRGVLATLRIFGASVLGTGNRADVLTGVCVATIAFLIYFPAQSDERIAVTAPGVDLSPLRGDASGDGDPSLPLVILVDRLQGLQLRDVLDGLAEPGRVVGDLISLAYPGGSTAYPLQIAAAFFGAATVALLVAIMRHLDIARTAAIASGLGFAFHRHTWSLAVVPDARMGSMALPALSVLVLLLWNETRKTRLLWLGLGCWLLSIAAHPLLLCTTPATAWLVYATTRQESRGNIPATAHAGRMLLIGVLLAAAGVGLAARPDVFDLRPLYDLLASEFGLLGFAFLVAGLIHHLRLRPTPRTLLLSLSLAAIVGWMSTSGSTDAQHIAAVLLFACPLVGYGMSVIARSRTDRPHTVTATAVLLAFPAVNAVSHDGAVDEARDDNARRVVYARALTAVLPDGGAIAALPRAREPLPPLWPLSESVRLRIVNLPWDARRIRDTAATQPTFALDSTRTRLEFLGFRFDEPGAVRAFTRLDAYLDGLAPGTIAAAVAGRDLVARAGPLIERTMRWIGGGRHRPLGRDHHYALIGFAGGGALLEQSDPGGVDLRLEAGEVLDDDGRLLPATLQVESVRGRARISVNGRPALTNPAGVGIVVLRADGAVERVVVAFDHDGELWIPVDSSSHYVSRLVGWQPCVSIGTDGWLDVSGLLTGSGAGFLFPSGSSATTFAVYVWKENQRLSLRQAASWQPQAGLTFETFDRTVPGEDAALERLLAFDGLAPDHRIRQQRFVQLLHVGAPDDGSPLTAVRFSGNAASGVARLLGPADAPRVTVCGAG